MKRIELVNGGFTEVDDEWYDFLSQWKWRRADCASLSYAMRFENLKAIIMHRVILGSAVRAVTDHRDGNGLNNQRFNLRPCTHTQNMQNSQSKTGTSSFKGVYWDNSKSRWCTQIVVNKKKVRRYFRDETLAARAYDVFAKQFFGEFARLNFV